MRDVGWGGFGKKAEGEARLKVSEQEEEGRAWREREREMGGLTLEFVCFCRGLGRVT